MIAFATHVQQLSFGAIYCRFNNYNFYSIEHPYFQDFKIIVNKFSSKLSFLKKKYRFFYFNRPETNFYKRNDYFSNKENDFPITENEKVRYIEEIHNFNKKYLYKKLTINKDINIENSTLVIHVRTGDIFDKDWHSLYTQNPLSYFLKISEEFEKVIIVCGNIHNNPVLEYLKQDKRFYIQSGTFEEDFNILLNAKNLATSGVSGFPISAALMSQKLENFYHSDLYLEEHLNPTMINKKYVNVHSYKINDYIQVGKFYKSKENLIKLLSTDKSKIIKY
tara:strand:+ start:2210 stop:3043 length:834 start_codon:yes stop_codon:yes gene_type:complete